MNIQDAVGAAAMSTPVGLGLAAAQTILGGVQTAVAQNKMKKLFKTRKAYETQQETYDIKNATAYNQQTGYGAKTLDFLETNANRGLTNSLSAILQMGGDPNMVSGLLDNYNQNIGKIGADDSLLQMKKFDQFLAATETLARSKDAEYQSKENLIKDQLQMYGQKAQAGQKNMQSGLNLGLSTLTSAEMMNLYKTKATTNGVAGGGIGRVGSPFDMRPYLPPRDLTGLDLDAPNN
jgi:hypothetical protein